MGTADIGVVAREIYEQSIRAQVEPQHVGRMLAVDVDSGDYEVDQLAHVASERLRARRPNANVFIMRVGFPTAYRMVGVRVGSQAR